jgi:DNA-binding winged helix-turn-helix (wHTH) protein
MSEIAIGGNALRLAARSWRIGPVLVELDRAEMVREGMRTRLRPKALEVLAALLAERGRVVMRQRLLEGVWPGLCVVEDSLTQCIAELRRALGPGAARRLVTIHRRGYMLAEAEPVIARPEPRMAERMAELESRTARLEAQLRRLEAGRMNAPWPLFDAGEPEAPHPLA